MDTNQILQAEKIISDIEDIVVNSLIMNGNLPDMVIVNYDSMYLLELHNLYVDNSPIFGPFKGIRINEFLFAGEYTMSSGVMLCSGVTEIGKIVCVHHISNIS